ncbi:hypothetical protein H6G72_12200 [Planktothricoides sp. FACHB-1370]|uniref:Uncharacterized protein n=2 Tax=Planktothricoides raciborskii TaxID=132608 RepID=A0ABR8EDD1_9CYAN|nr:MULTISPECIES: hypothetical protein [Planktothricoides]KOR38467.1 hypothetical protein AM228_00175 [Planktothricoides sp. SR001]MBD2544585.1 hypothetical protein [Planktothricoides raciborskii FACHB-1370]MBD2583530.1 hypothetical protein [Planktothricoides raciborskii FACHB-1261]
MLFKYYLITLIQAWIKDLAYHWKIQKHPSIDLIKEIGLFDCLADGYTEQLEYDNVCDFISSGKKYRQIIVMIFHRFFSQ